MQTPAILHVFDSNLISTILLILVKEHELELTKMQQFVFAGVKPRNYLTIFQWITRKTDEIENFAFDA
jgi:hypothetical protein